MSTCNSSLAGEIIAFTYPALIKTSDNQVIPRVQGGNRCILDVFTNPNANAEPNALANTSDGNGTVTSMAIGQQGAGAKICGPVVLAGSAAGNALLGICGGGAAMECNICVNGPGTNTLCGTTNTCDLNVASDFHVNTGESCYGAQFFTNICVSGQAVIHDDLIANADLLVSGSDDGGDGSICARGNVNVTGNINAGGDITAFWSSDERLKNNIIKINNSTDVINNISGYSYDWNEKSGKEGSTVGVIAQEVKELIPSAVRENSNGYLAVDYIKLIPYLIEEVKSLNNRIKTLEEK